MVVQEDKFQFNRLSLNCCLSGSTKECVIRALPDVQCRGSYPSFAKKIWKEYDLDPAFFEQDAEILREGKVDLFTFSYYNTSCVTTHQDVPMDSGGNLTLGAKNPYLKYSDWGWSVDADGLRYILNEINGRYQLPDCLSDNILLKVLNGVNLKRSYAIFQ